MKSEQRKKEDRELIERLLKLAYIDRPTDDEQFETYTLNSRAVKWFIESEGLTEKPKLELNRWIVNDNSPEWMIYLDGEDGRYYCIDSNGKWIFREHSFISNAKTINNYNEHSEFRYATDEEILEKLSKIAVEMGYKERQSECLYSCIDNVDLSNSVFELSTNGSLWITSCSPLELNCIFKDGKWAKFIETDTERIERLEKRVKELENKNK